MRPVIKEAVDLIRRTEKCSLHPYEGGADAEGIMTIGYGHVIGHSEEWMLKGVTQAQAEEIFSRDIAMHSNHIQCDLGHVNIDDYVYGALASLCFNCGPRTLLGAPSITENMRKGKIKEGVLNMYKFSISDKKYRDGLFYRRLTEMVLALDHELVKKPDNCKEAKPLFERLAKHGNIAKMQEYFAKNHRRDLCRAC